VNGYAADKGSTHYGLQNRNGKGESLKVEKAKDDSLIIENLEEILSILRHELGNPINSLKITLDVLKESYDFFDDVKKKAYLRRASELLARQEKLIEAMKFYSKFKVRKQKDIAFLPFWESFSAMATNKLKEENIKLINNIDTRPCHIKVDNQALNNVMTNILNNAIEAVKEVDEPEIELNTLKKNNFIMISMKDNGLGIKKNLMSKIFIPLYTTKPGKLGMGLPIARKLSFEMDGRIEIESKFGSGAEARLWFKTQDYHEG
jgi:signal transduction histidine kinase